MCFASWDALLQRGWNRSVTDNDDMAGIVNSTVPHFFAAWRNFSTIEQVDFSRYALLYREGGVYADTDQEVCFARSLHLKGGP